MNKNLFFLLLNVLLGTCFANAQTIWDVKSIYGTINEVTLQTAINDAISERAANPNVDVVLSLASGTYYLNDQIEINNLNASGTGWLIIQGQGEDNTILEDTEYNNANGVTFRSVNPYRLKFRNLSIKGQRLCHSQGTIVNKSGNVLDIDLDDNFPTPNEMYEIETQTANKIRLFVDTDLNSPHYIEGPTTNDHQELRWTFGGDDSPEGRPVPVSGRTWRFYLTDYSENPFKTGDRVGISSKSNRGEWGYFVGNGADIVVENVKFEKISRVKFRSGWNNIRFSNVRIVRPIVNNKPAFYTADAGPQFGHDPDNQDVYNLTVEDCDFRGTADDGSAFQRVQSGIVRNCYFEDGGGILIGVNCSGGLVFQNNVHYHNPLEDERAGKVHFQGAYNPDVVVQGTSALLTWSAGSRTDSHDVYFGTSFPLSKVTSTPNTSYTVNGLQANTTYYWMVWEQNTTDNLGVNKSDIWAFTTGSFGSIPTDGAVVRIESVSNGLWMRSTTTMDYDPIELVENTYTGDKTKWLVEEAPDGYLRFININSIRPLRPEQNAVNSIIVTGEITQKGYYTQWNLQDQGNGEFLLTNRKTGMYMSPVGNVSGSGVQLVTTQSNATLWKFIPVDSTKSAVATITYPEADNRIRLYPNPVVRDVTIELNTKNAYNGGVIVFNSNGQKIVEKDILSKRTILDLSKLKSGVYFVQIQNDNIVERRKIVVM